MNWREQSKNNAVRAYPHRLIGIEHLNAHSRWGQYKRLAAKTATYNIGL